jgi:ADYC domain
MKWRSMTVGMRFKTLSAFLLVVGCADQDTPKTATMDQGILAANGVSLNGVSMNGVSVNGVSMNGVSMNGVSMNGVSMNGVSVNGVSMNGISMNGVSMNGVSLNGVSMNGISMNGTDFIGAHFTASMSNGGSLDLRIDDIDPLAGTNDDVLAYEVNVATDGGWTSLCGYEADGSARRALAVPGTWDLATGAWSDTGNTFSFACRAASIAKCVELGYKTWDGFGDHQHACVRMLRADYCGDGNPHTVNGTPINIYDNAGVQTDTESWNIDGEWTADGSLCFNNYRGSSTMPSCSQKYSTSCGTFANGALLINERQ